MNKIASLNDVMSYDNEEVIYRFLEHFDISPFEAKDIWDNQKKWLWLCANAIIDRKLADLKVPPRLVMDTPILIIDEMWHNFLCFTFDYAQFCENHFGFFIHHYPTKRSAKNRLASEIKSNPEIQLKRREVQFTYIYDKLGQETLLHWYDFYPKKYSTTYISALRKK